MEEIDEEIDKEITKVSQRILKSFPDIKQKINPEPYHFIEICIIFSEYCEDNTISKDDFIAANKIFSDDEDSEDINNSKDEIFTKIYNFISGNSSNNSIPLFSLFGYLRIISITEKLNNEILFKILDRKEKGSIEFDNVETLISNLEDFLDIKEDLNDFNESFKGKKLTMRNLSQGDFASKIKKLFYLAEVKIYDMAKKSFEAYESNNNKEEENINNNIKKTHSRKSSSDISSSKEISRRSGKKDGENEINIGNNKEQFILNLQDSNDDGHRTKKNKSTIENNKENNQAIIPYDSSGNINNNNNSIGINLDEANFDESLFEKIFDKRKELKIHQIKNSSLLYDIDLDEFLSEFKKYETTIFDKNKFISVLCEIIQAQTSEVFKGPMLRYSLSLLYQIIDIEKKNKLSYYEILGPITVLTKAKTEDRLNIIFSYKPPELISIICGILSLYLNTEIIKDFNILSEIFIKACYQMDINKSQNFLEWIFSNKNEEVNLDKDFDFLIEEENMENIDDKNNVNNKIIKQLNSIFGSTNFFGMDNFHIIDVTNKIIYNYSLLGQMNLNHLNLLIDDLLNIKYGSQKTKEKTRYKQEFLAFIEKFINFSKTELIDITLLHSLFILIFSGSTLDKIRSIFIIHDLNETENIKSSDFCNYIIHMFYFMLKEIELGENNNLYELANDLGKNIVENITKGKESICFGNIVEYFDNVDFGIPS
jgi:hypothetical protein